MMSRWTMTGMAVFAAIALVACDRSNENAKAVATSAQPSAGENAQTTLTGCLETGDQPGRYRLIVAENPDQSPRPTATSGTVGTDDAGRPVPVNRVYHVIPQNGDSNANAGARVTVIGVVDTLSPEPRPDAAAPAGSTSRANEARTVRATSITTIAERCQ